MFSFLVVLPPTVRIVRGYFPGIVYCTIQTKRVRRIHLAWHRTSIALENVRLSDAFVGVTWIPLSDEPSTYSYSCSASLPKTTKCFDGWILDHLIFLRNLTASYPVFETYIPNISLPPKFPHVFVCQVSVALQASMRVRQLKFGEVPALKKFETWSDQKSKGCISKASGFKRIGRRLHQLGQVLWKSLVALVELTCPIEIIWLKKNVDINLK